MDDDGIMIAKSPKRLFGKRLRRIVDEYELQIAHLQNQITALQGLHSQRCNDVCGVEWSVGDAFQMCNGTSGLVVGVTKSGEDGETTIEYIGSEDGEHSTIKQTELDSLVVVAWK